MTTQERTLEDRIEEPLRFSEIKFRLAPEPGGDLIAYASCVVNDSLVLNDVQVRRGRQGGILLVFPSRESRSGHRHFVFHPIDRGTSEAFRAAILDRLSDLITSAVDKESA